MSTASSKLDLSIPHHGVHLLKLIALTPSDTIMLHDLNLVDFSEGIRPVKPHTNYQGDSMRIAGRFYQNGIGLQSVSVLPFELNGKGLKFHALVGADDAGNKNLPIQFHVLGDGRLLYKSSLMNVGDPAEIVDIDIKGIKRLGLLVIDSVGGIANKRTYGNFANAYMIMRKGAKPEPVPNDLASYIQIGRAHV